MSLFRGSPLARRLLPAAAALALIVGAVIVSARRADQGLRADLLRQTRIAAMAIHPQRAAALTGRETDLSSPPYLELKNQLASIRSANPKIRFLYLMERNPAGDIVFLVDNEAETSPDYSPPGQIYEEASAGLRSAFEKKQEMVDGPEQDRWGTWVSGFVPLPGREFEDRSILLGMDVDARDWRRAVATHATLPAAVAIIAILLAWGSVLLQQSRRDLRARQAEVQESEKRLADLAEQSRTLVWETDADGLYTYVSPVVEAVLGYRPDELAGKKHFYDLHPAEGREALRQSALGMFQRRAEFKNLENPMQTKDGRTAWVSTNGMPLLNRDGSLRGYRGSDIDITERKQAEEALRVSENQKKSILNAISINIALLDPELKILWANQAAADSTGRRPDEMAGTPCHAFWGDPAQPCKDCPAAAALRSGRPEHTTVQTPDGRIWDETAEPILDAQGRVSAIVEIAQDITRRTAMEKQMLALLEEGGQARQALLGILEDEKRVREELERRIEELNHAQTALVRTEKLASLGKLISEVAHEISNPLMIISCNAQLALMPEIGGDEAGGLLRIIGDECQRAKAILKRLLHFSAPGKGPSKPVDLNASLEVVAGMLENQLKWSHVEIRRSYAEHLPPVSIDESQMQEVFMNLINNAREAMPDGGTLFLSTSREGDRVRLDFRDTGIGIPEEFRKSIFEPFFTTKEEGAGLGLPVCYAIVQAHGGEIRFESQPKAGTTFTIHLPAAKDVPPAG